MKFTKLFLLLALSQGALATPAMEALLNHPIDERVREFKELKAAGGYSFLASAAFDKKNGLQTRWRAITTMGRLDAAAFRKELDRALTGPEWYMRNAALIALQTDDRQRAIASSMRLLDDPALVVRTQAVRNLIQLEAREAEPKMWEKIFSDKNFRGKESLWVRVHLAEALAGFATPGRTRSFQRLLMDSDERLHKWAILGLEKTTGIKLGGRELSVEIRRQQWLSRLGVEEI
ncbi:MAG: HEAT repeat domain-containing protein [Bdellovibrionales bacterium]